MICQLSGAEGAALFCFRHEGMVGVGLEKAVELSESFKRHGLVAVGRLDFREATHGQLELGLRGKRMEREEFKELPVLEAGLFVLTILVEGVGQVDEGLEAKLVVGSGLENTLELLFGLRIPLGS